MNQRESRLHYGLISKYRSLLMSVAILLVLFCHLINGQWFHGVESTRLSRILHMGEVGVDVFLFLSGVGLYYSYTRNRPTYLAFERKRFRRILPYYLLIGGFTYLISDVLVQRLSFGQFFCDLFFLSWFRGHHQTFWYVLEILVLYLLFPFLYAFLHNKQHGFFKAVTICAAWFVAMRILADRAGWFDNVSLALERLPIFVLGVYTGKPAYEKRPVKAASAALYLLTGILFLALQKRGLSGPLKEGLYYPMLGALAVSIITAVILFMELLEKTAPRTHGAIVKAFGWYGGLTYELYLLQQCYRILFHYPYRFVPYLLAAFVLPTITAAGIYFLKKTLGRRQNEARMPHHGTET